MIDLASLRTQIDQIDQQLLTLLTERAQCAQAVGKIKQQQGDTVMYRPEREADVLRRIMRNNTSPFEDADVARLFREIMSMCLALEQPLKVAYLGPAGTFTHQAVQKHFGYSAKALPLRAIDEIFREVAAGNVDYGVVPVENSTEGVVNHTLDTFLNTNLSICGEAQIRIQQNLISHQSSLNTIKVIYSHPQSLAQCRQWLDAHLPSVERIPVSSNAEAVKMLTEFPQAAAIAGKVAAELYNAPILAEHIEDEPNNTTRFLVIGTRDVAATGADKTSILVSSEDRPGLLLHLIEPLAKHRVTMSRIESRPSRKGMWNYVFFIDVLGHHSDSHVAAALAEIKAECSLFRVLGSYPSAIY